MAAAPVLAEDVFKLINAGDAAVSRQEYTAALSAYSRAIELDPKQQLAYTKRAAVYVSTHKHSLAILDLDRALQLDGAAVSVLLKRGQLHLQLCSFALAERDFASVLALRPEHKSARSGVVASQEAHASLRRAEELLAANNIPATDKELTKVYHVSHDCLPARLMSAQMFLAESKVEEAIAETGRILKMDPANVPALLMRGQGYYLLEDFDMAKRHYGEVLTKYDPEHKQAKQLFTKLKTLQRRLNSVADAAKTRQWVEVEADSSALLHEMEEGLKSKRAEMWMLLGNARFHLRRDDDAIVLAADSALHYVYNSEAVVLKAKTFIRAERWEAAIQVLETAVNEHGRTQQLLGLLQEAQKGLKKSKQIDYYKILGVSKDVDDKTLKKAYRRLALLHHPDKVDGEDKKAAAQKKLTEINGAYEVLSNPEKRALHDDGEDPNDPAAGNQGGNFHGGFPGGFGGFHGGFQQGRTFHFQT